MIASITSGVIIFIFGASIAAMFYTYVLFPLILKWLSANKKFENIRYEQSSELPFISVLISAYNEQDVIEKKINSIYHTTYPADKFEVLIGSDASDDLTDSIIRLLTSRYNSLKFFPFTQRSGKGNVINRLYEKSKGSILVFTDANVILEESSLFELVKYFKDSKIGLVDSQMINTNLQTHGISFQEKAYISREVKIKQAESLLWGTMMGPFGGCFAIKKELYTPVPKNFLVDDFFINMTILEKGYKCINNLEARVYEDVSNNLADEFKRKIRIATGNFQNLHKFSNLLFHQTKGLSFCFISHKVLRWFGPFFIILALVSNFILAFHNEFFFTILILQLLILVLPLIDLLLKMVNVHIHILRLVTHFYTMNVALMIGFFKSLQNIETNVWKPTQRNQN